MGTLCIPLSLALTLPLTLTLTLSLPSATFQVTVATSAHPGPLTGWLVVVVSKTKEPEPRFAISPSGPAIFAIDLEQLAPERPAVVGDKALGYPTSRSDLPPGDYFAQAVVNVYEQVRRADGHAIWVHLNDGRIEFFTQAAGNLYSDVQAVHIGDGKPVRLVLNHVIPKADRPVDTEWVKHVSIQSEKLTRFWGRPIFVHATVLLPGGYDAHPSVRYLSLYTLGHGTQFQFTTDSTGIRNLGKLNPVSATETGYDFFRSWDGDGFPRVIAISLEQQTPYFPDAYSVNSANNGPYGDAVIEEVMPALEERFRIIRSPSARHLEGASTSGWQTLAMQLQHPEFFGGAWILQPDPIDFRRYQTTDIYDDENAFTLPVGQFVSAERPFRRTTEGQPVWSVRQLSRFESVLGTKGRSGYQLAAWEAVYGPTDAEGYPRPLWDKQTGKIAPSRQRRPRVSERSGGIERLCRCL